MNNFGRNLVIWLVIFLIIGGIVNNFKSEVGDENIAFSDFMREVEEGQISDVVIIDNSLTGHYTGGRGNFSTLIPNYPDLVGVLLKKGVVVKAANPDNSGNIFINILISLLPIILLIGVWVFFMKQMQGGKGGGGAMGFGKSKAKLLTEKHGVITFGDVAGIDEAKDELSEIVDFLKNPTKFQKLGGKIPKGVLLTGSPGTGKTLLARSIAGEAEVPFFTISGSDFVEMFVGVGASRVRDMFEQGRKNAPCIIFIDEIDAVGRHRGSGMGNSNDEREQTLNQILVEMDGFESHEGVIIVAATNRPDVLDPALLRPGRFDRQVEVPLPDILGRKKILGIHLRKVPQAPDVDPHVIARGTPGFSGADLANLVNEAALMAARLNKKVVTMREMEAAKDKVMMGAERKSMVMRDEEKELTAYHEAGHALVGINCPESDPIHKATIMPRGRALGMVMQLPEHDRLSHTKGWLKADLAVFMGGRVAEELIFGEDKVTSGASSDIQVATNMARSMVTKWGMSKKIGPVLHNTNQNYSEEMSNLIASEIKFLIDEGNARATKILTEKLDDLHLIAKALIEYETLSGEEINDLLAGKKIREDSGDDKNKKPPRKRTSVPKSGEVKKDGKPPATPPEPESA